MNDLNKTERIWDPFLTPRDREIFGAAGFAQTQGFGQRPVILVIDVNYNFCGDRPEPIMDSVKRWPNSCGEDAWNALPHIQSLLSAARQKGLPIVYTTGGFRSDGWDFGSWRWKHGRLDPSESTPKPNIDGDAIVSEIEPAPQDLVIRKLKPSAFHGTPLNSFLNLLKADSLIVCGTTTSGCVRASVIDAFSENYRVAVAEEGCFDRAESSHAINLLDMQAKYADVVPASEIVEFIEALPSDLFDLPSGK